MGRFFANINWITFLLLCCIGLSGLFLLLTIDTSYFFQQALFLIIGFSLAFILSQIDAVFLWWIAPLFYIGSIFFIVLSFVSPEVRGAHRWIIFHGMQLQPSEFVKPFLIISLARYITEYPPRILKYTPLHIGLFAVPFFLVFRQPDLGTAIVYIAVWLGMMLAGGLPLRYLLETLAFVGGLSPIFWHFLAEYQKNRIISFLNPNLDPQGVGYNALQAIIAVGSGQWFGRGLGRGTQSHLRFLPEFHTDFIYATLIEEFGFVGGVLLLTLYVLLLWRILSPLLTRSIDDRFCYVYSLGVFCMVLTQVFINAGMNMGIVPVTGITLPFVSYGGSSILSISMSFGLLWALQVARSEPTRIAME